MIKSHFIPIILSLLLLIFYACKDEAPIAKYDPSKPVTITSFSPDSGGVATRLIILGNNFGNDTTQLKVSLFDPARNKETLAKVVGATNECIYALLPRRAGSDNQISVRVKVGSSPMVEATKKFSYKLAQSVSTLVGAVINVDGTGGEINGTFDVAMLSLPRNITYDATTNSLFVTGYEGWGYGIQTIRRIDMNEKVVTSVGIGIVPPDGIVAVNGDIFATTAFGHDNLLFRMNKNNAYSNEKFIDNSNDKYFYWGGDITYNTVDKLLYLQSNYATLSNIKTIDPNALDRESSIKIFYEVSQSEVEFCLAVDSKGTIYYSLESQHAIYKLEKEGGTVVRTLFAGKDGTKGYKNGNGADALFNTPEKMVFDNEDNMYVCDLGNQVIRKITPDGEVTLLAGVPNVAGKDDGKPLESKFYEPRGICIDNEGVIYISDRGNHRIRKISIE